MQVIKVQAGNCARCTVRIGNHADIFTNFVAVGYNEAKGVVSLVGNADLLTLATALEIISNNFKKRFAELSPEDQAIFQQTISGGLL